MGRIAVAVATLLLAGCAAVAGEPVAIVTDTGSAPNSVLGCWLPINDNTLLLVADPKFGTAFKSANGDTVAAKWPSGYTGHRAGSEVEVYDAGGRLVATTGRSYRIDWVNIVRLNDGTTGQREFGQVICEVHPA